MTQKDPTRVGTLGIRKSRKTSPKNHDSFCHLRTQATCFGDMGYISNMRSAKVDSIGCEKQPIATSRNLLTCSRDQSARVILAYKPMHWGVLVSSGPSRKLDNLGVEWVVAHADVGSPGDIINVINT